MNLNTRLVLVTGALGWLGSRLIEIILNGLSAIPGHDEGDTSVRVRCLVLPDQDASALRALSTRIEVVTGDIRNPADCEKLFEGAEGSLLLHTAGVIHPRRVREFYAVNAEGTERLLSAAANAGLRRAVVVSSNSPCGVNPHPDHTFDEVSPYRPYLHYGRSKMRMELAALQMSRTGKLEVTLVRAPWFYGPNQPARQTLFFKMVRDGKAPIVGPGNNLRSMAYVDNLCQGLLLAAVAERANGQVYWISDRRPYSMAEIVDTIERLLETEFGQKCAHRRLRLPSIVSSMAYAADCTLQAMGLYHQKIHVLSEMNKTIACSIRKAEQELGYRPTIELEEGMRRSLAWCIRHGRSADFKPKP